MVLWARRRNFGGERTAGRGLSGGRGKATVSSRRRWSGSHHGERSSLVRKRQSRVSVDEGAAKLMAGVRITRIVALYSNGDLATSWALVHFLLTGSIDAIKARN